MQVLEKLSLLREAMEERSVDAYLVVSEDFHGSEYVGEYFKEREYLSGFTGSAGTLVVCKKEAALFTDGRYFIQADKQLKGSGITLMRRGEAGVPTVAEYLGEMLPKDGTLGFDGRTVNVRLANQLKETLSEKNIRFLASENLTDVFWKDRPALSKAPAFALPDKGTGLTRAKKLKKVRRSMEEEGADFLFLCALDEIAWLLNLRGGDIAYTPVFLAFALVEKEKCTLFINRDKLSAELKDDLLKDGVYLRDYGEIFTYLPEIAGEQKIWYDPASTNYRLGLAIQNGLEKESPVILLKAVKNETEIAGMKEAHIRDGVAVCRFLSWLKEAVKKERVTELTAAAKIEEFRRKQEGFLESSFASIIAYREHGAIVHYEPTKESDAVILPEGLCLCDTGGHYLCGTTDITRTVVLGALSKEEKEAFTLVLKGHIRLACARFTEGVCGADLDMLSRMPLWVRGMDFNHGTGHGVGHILCVHEGPQRISNLLGKEVENAPLHPGMITSNEPGFYKEGAFGIRHENLMLTVKTKEEGFLKQEPLTLVPFDLEGIQKDLLTSEEIGWLNAYHEKVYAALSPFLNEKEKEWLLENTRKI